MAWITPSSWRSKPWPAWYIYRKTNQPGLISCTIHSLQSKCTSDLFDTTLGLNLWLWCSGPPTLPMCYANQLKSLVNSRNSRPSRPKLIHCFSPQHSTLLSSLVVVGSTCWHKGQRFNPRGWAKSWHAQLLCNERKVHRKPWFVCTGLRIIIGY